MNATHSTGRFGLHTVARAALLAVTALAGQAQAQTLSYIGQQIIPTGATFQGTTVGGLSGLDYTGLPNTYIAISDDRSALNPARYYGLQLDLSKFQRSATPGQAGVTFTGVTTLLRPDGTAFPANLVDPESIRYNRATGNLVWSNEGQRAAAGFQNPTVRQATVGGTYLSDLAVPNRYLPVGSNAGTAPGDRGIYNNLAFESLTISPDGRTVYTATENSLTQDGPIATVNNGSSARILSFDAATGQAGAEWIYPVSPVVLQPQPAGLFTTNGLVEMIATGDGQFIAMERSFSIGAVTPGNGPNGLPTGYTVRLYNVDTRGATDVSGLDSIAGQAVTPATKTLLLDLVDLRNDDGSAVALDNLEGMTLGPIVDGQQTLILVSDNNFGSTQFTQFVALSMAPVPEPTPALLLAGGLALLAWRARAARPAR